MATSKPFTAVSPGVQLPEEERRVLKLWADRDTFQKSIEQNANGPFFSFYDGPPFATGLPHYGHILAGVLKDIIPRYWTMRGYQVPRYFGWDCHGVPVEYEVNKQFKISSSAQVREMGVATYNEACRSIVDRYTSEWERTVQRMGRWVDMKNNYKTMDLSFMQSVWWVFKELWKKGLIYEGYKVVPYSIGISTALSNFEASQNYKIVQDPAVTVKFQSSIDSNKYFLAWTTTPWTLPSNLALAVGGGVEYVEIEGRDKKHYVLAKNLLSSYAKEFGEEPKVVKEFTGKELVNQEYEPLFGFFSDLKSKSAFRIITSSHVTTDAGTGIVHMAPAFGEDDFFACQNAGIPIVNPVDDDGKFTSEVPDYQGLMVKDADKIIIKDLKKYDLLFRQETIDHSYPHCERTDTPLIYRAVSSWFVNVEKIKGSLLKNNQKTKWVPENLRDGRFGNWLENARDWAVSRSRFWGTPLPIWKNEEGEVICVGSAEELEKLSGEKVTDLHIHHIDHIKIPSPTGKSPLKRVTGVLDCWFESGSMPYAQWGYPFDNSKKANFEKGFPADFIAEGLDQTRGWFYTLMVIATALFDQPAFKNVVVNGIVLAEDGRKMSKRLRNYPDPMEVLDRHGADALRLYLIDSPVVRAQDLKFAEVGVRDVVRRILLRWWNAYGFFINYANTDHFTPSGGYEKSPNILDKWIISRLNSLAIHTNFEMESYRLYNVVPALLEFIDQLTNTYIRFNRRHFWQEGMPEDKRLAYETLYFVLLSLSKLMAPFTPFISEMIYQNLSNGGGGLKESVHLEKYFLGNPSSMNVDLEQIVSLMEKVCEMGRNIREKISIKAKIPLKSLTIIHRDLNVLNRLKSLESYFSEELNVRQVNYIQDEESYVSITVKANFAKLGPRLGKKMGLVNQEIKKLSIHQILSLESGGSLEIQGELITIDDVEIQRTPKISREGFQVSREVAIELDSELETDQIQEGLVREVIRRIQIARKNADFELDDRIRLEFRGEGSIQEAVNQFQTMLMKETLCQAFEWSKAPTGEHIESFDLEGSSFTLGIRRLGKV